MTAILSRVALLAALLGASHTGWAAPEDASPGALSVGGALAMDPGWSALAPWRTWTVVDDLGPAVHWFVVDDATGAYTGCEIGVHVDDADAGATVWCSGASIDRGGRRPVPRALAAEARAATAAVRDHLGLRGAAGRALSVDFLGTLRRVALRQVVVIEAADTPADARAWTLAGLLDVDVDLGRVAASPLGWTESVAPLCRPGVHPGCDAPPRLVDHTPAAAWDGMLLATEPGEAEGGQLEALGAAVRAVVLGGAGFVTPRPTPGGLLPDDLAAGAVVSADIEVVGADGAASRGTIHLDVPLNLAAFGPAVVPVQPQGASTTATFSVDLRRGEVAVELSGEGAPPTREVFPTRCTPLVDGDQAVLAKPCSLSAAGRWVGWEGPDGARMVVTLRERVLPLTRPTRGPGLR
jgi:hypothetical protein